MEQNTCHLACACRTYAKISETWNLIHDNSNSVWSVVGNKIKVFLSWKLKSIWPNSSFLVARQMDSLIPNRCNYCLMQVRQQTLTLSIRLIHKLNLFLNQEENCTTSIYMYILIISYPLISCYDSMISMEK